MINIFISIVDKAIKMIKVERAGKSNNQEINIQKDKILPDLSGSLGLRRRKEEEEEPEEDPNDEPEEDGPIVILPSVPDFALQFAISKNSNTEKVTEKIKPSLKEELRIKGFPDADVRTKFVDQDYKIFVWLTQSLSVLNDRQREMAVDRLSVRNAEWTQTVFINESSIWRDLYKAWNNAPKVLNHDGDPDPSGPTHLTGFSMKFNNNNQLITKINGYDETPWPDASFEVVITDTFTTGNVNGEIQVDTERDLDIDTRVLTGLSFIPILGLFFVGEIIVISYKNPGAPDEPPSPGESISLSFPNEIYVEGGKKMIFTYNEIETKERMGIFASGYVHGADRQPAISTPEYYRITVNENAKSANIRFNVVTTDLRPTLRVSWKVDDIAIKTTSHSRTSIWTLLSLECRKAKHTIPVSRKVTVKVTDADGLEATLEKTMLIYTRRPAKPAEPGEGSLPDICEIRPWLPQCKTEDL